MNAFVGFDLEETHFVVELTYNYGIDKNNLGTSFGHFNIMVKDVYKTFNIIKSKGDRLKGNHFGLDSPYAYGGKMVITFVKYLNGYKFEIIHKGPTPEPLCQVTLKIRYLDYAINVYKKVFGMEIL
eukprot:Gb_19631 [translate_table: standard]